MRDTAKTDDAARLQHEDRGLRSSMNKRIGPPFAQGRPGETSPSFGSSFTVRKRNGAQGGSASRRWLVPSLVGGAAALGALALYVNKRARDAERRYPPIGRFMTVDGVRLHYLERGQGEPLVLFHGDGSLIQDFATSGIVDRLADRYRVIVFDRPGYGYSARPRIPWTPTAYAKLFRRALARLGVDKAVVLGHSWGTLAAIALALESPFLVRGLVLAAGYYYPTLRPDALLLSPTAIPGIGDAMRHTISPLIARLVLPHLIQKIFAPAPVPEHFDRLMPKELLLRPSHLRAASEDTALLIPSVVRLQHRYRELKMPVVIITGADDRIVDVGSQSERLHRELPGSELISLPGLGHMVHHLAPDEVIEAIDRAARRSSGATERQAATEGATAFPA